MVGSPIESTPEWEGEKLRGELELLLWLQGGAGGEATSTCGWQSGKRLEREAVAVFPAFPL